MLEFAVPAMFLQTAPDTLFHWLYTNAPAAWISALVATAGFIIVLSSRKKPRRLVVREVRNTSLVTVWPNVRDQIQMTFAGRPIAGLGQVDLEIYNEGSDVIRNAYVDVSFAEDCKVLGLLVKPELLGARSLIHPNGVSITFPYVNPYGEHKEEITTSIVIDGHPASLKITGTGEGWSLRYSALPTEEQTQWRTRIARGLMLVWLVASFFYGRFLEQRFRISAFELSWRALFVSFVPNLLVLILVLAVAGLLPGKYSLPRGRSP